MSEFDKAPPRPWVDDDGDLMTADRKLTIAMFEEPLDNDDRRFRDALALTIRAVNSFNALVTACEWALAKFTDPYSLDTDPAAVQLKELCETALKLAEGK